MHREEKLKFGTHHDVTSVQQQVAPARTTWGITQYQYDGLGRQTLLIPPDGTATANNETTTYTGNNTTVKDEVGDQWQRTSDALGRLTKVLEPLPLYFTECRDGLHLRRVEQPPHGEPARHVL